MAESFCHLPGCKNCTKITGDGSAPFLTVRGSKAFFCSHEHLREYEDQVRKAEGEALQLELSLFKSE